MPVTSIIRREIKNYLISQVLAHLPTYSYSRSFFINLSIACWRSSHLSWHTILIMHSWHGQFGSTTSPLKVKAHSRLIIPLVLSIVIKALQFLQFLKEDSLLYQKKQECHNFLIMFPSYIRFDAPLG
jgi:hypothetical protein